MGLFGSIAGFLAGGKAKKGSRRAQEAQTEALNKAIAEQQRQFDLTSQTLQPNIAAGQVASTAESDLLGLNGDDAAGDSIARLKASPLFQSLFDTGEETILANASATGGLRGGNTQDSLADFSRDTLASVIENQLSRLGNVSNRGVGAASNLGQLGANASNNVSQFLNDQGNVKASGILTRAGITGQQFNNAGSFLDSAVKSFIPGGNIVGSIGKLF